jgi:hypothetical protein
VLVLDNSKITSELDNFVSQGAHALIFSLPFTPNLANDQLTITQDLQVYLLWIHAFAP